MSAALARMFHTPSSRDAARARLARRPKLFRPGLYENILPGEEGEANNASRTRSKSQQKGYEISGLARFWTLVLLLAGMTRDASAVPGFTVEPFSLPAWDGKASVRLEDYAGKVLVLDFFAYWCVPCAKASAEVESRVRAHYEAKRGNPHGIEVEVLSVNVEADHRSKTDAFIRKHRLHKVVDDRDGVLLGALGGTGLPYVVIIDGTAGSPAGPAFRGVYRKAGFEGAERLKAVIDRIGEGKPAASLRPEWGPGEVVRERIQRGLATGDYPMWVALDGSTPRSQAPVGGGDSEEAPDSESVEASPPDRSRLPQRASGSFEGVFSTDIQLSQESVRYQAGSGDWEVSVTGSGASFGIDYQPVAFDFLGTAERIDAWRGGVQGAGKWRVQESWTVQGGGGFYEGYTDYRSVWLAEYYRQQFEALPDYVAPDPGGHNVSAGVRWEYAPATGFVQLDVSYLADEIAPGYEIDFEGLRRGRPNLYTTVWRLAFENVWNRRVRVLHEFRRIDTSDRELRIGYQGTLHWALGERWVARVQGGATAEQPEFSAWYAGGALEYELSSRWRMNVAGRYYEDTGEIENSNFSNAAPAIRTWHAGAGVRYEGDRWSIRVFAAPYATRYEPFGIGTAFFGNLYRSRDWGLCEFSAEYTW